MHRHLKHRKVESVDRASGLIRVLHGIDYLLLWPLLFDTIEYLARYLVQENAGKEISAEILIFNDMERLLQDVEAE